MILKGFRYYHVQHIIFSPLRFIWCNCDIVNPTFQVILNFIWLIPSHRPTAIITSIAVCHHPCIFSSPYNLPYFQASRLSMNIRAITVERGIATLANQSRLSSLLPFSSHGSRNRGVGEIGASSVDGISSPAGIPARQEEEELEGGYDDDDEDNDARFEERDDDGVEEIIQEDRSMTRGEDVERAIDHCKRRLN